MISAAGIKDQELTIIVSMMLIELALLRLSRFKRLAVLDTQGLELLVALHPRVWWARRAGQLASVRRADDRRDRSQHRTHRNRADSSLRDRPGDDARALGCLSYVSPA